MIKDLYARQQWDELAKELLPFACFLARAFHRRHHLQFAELDELESIAVFELGKAIDRMRSKQHPEPNPRGLVRCKVNGALMDWLEDRIDSREVNNVFYQPEAQPEHLLADATFDPEAHAEVAETLERIFAICEKYNIDPRIVRGRLANKTLDEIADECDLSPSSVKVKLARLNQLFGTKYV